MPVGAIVGVGALGAGTSLLASSNATNAASNAASASNALESQIYNNNSAMAQPYIQGGDAAESELNGFLGLGGNPAATQTAFNNYLNSTGYQFALGQGLNAATQSKAAAGMLNSGATLKALDAYGTGEAQQYGQQYAGNLQSLVGTGAGAVNALSGAGQNYANSVSSNNNSAATTSANAGLSAANSTNALLGQGLNAYGLSQGGSSFGVGANSSSFNAFVPGG